ncbi:DUF6671 family protein [Jiangella muralis]|uniref:DUF6671 family protein n=1 Tax=Jiangella muralis TaxID=702383 RepID=UPI000AC421C9|nr:DUF6671 family protein [Jiangella muralis]
MSSPSGDGAVPRDAGRRPVVSYTGRRAVLATKHDKLPLVAPPLAASGLEVTAVAIDTDQLGTFTGDIPRPGTPLDTAIAKARLGMAAAGTSLGVASEGSVGPHPASPLLTADAEIVVLVDADRDVVVWDRAISLDIRAAAQAVEPGHDMTSLTRRFDLPGHAVIVRPNHGPPAPVLKGLRGLADIKAAVATCAAASPDGRARVETDLRAHMCPSRRPVIRQAAERLAARLATRCPACTSPGWGPIDAVTGVPCAWCGTPVDDVRAETDGCPACGHRAERAVIAPGTTADPGRCPRCNP